MKTVSSIADLGRLMQDADVVAVAIRRPSEMSRGGWQVSTKKNDDTLNWVRGKPKPTFVEALESCFGVKVVSTDLSDLLG